MLNTEYFGQGLNFFRLKPLFMVEKLFVIRYLFIQNVATLTGIMKTGAW